MRASTSKILLFAALCTLAPAASARSHKPASKPTHVSAKSAKVSSKAGKKTSRKVSAAAAKPGKMSKHGKASEVSKAGHSRHRHAEEAVAESPRLARVHGHHKAVIEAPKPVARVTRPEAIEPEVQPQVEAEQETIHVTHNRKQHLTPQAEEQDIAPRKATPADFLSKGSGPEALMSEQPLSGVSHPDDADEPGTRPEVRPSVTKSVPAIVVARKLDPKPPIVMVKDLTPEPVMEPALYNKRGRLIMPPALKGSHEILLHQNQVADSEGLERIKDDNDLEQMRSNKILVALPTGAGIQTDERLPMNRRYCRPWAAAFLTALARAHYARFHTPLQVNSAVRTVEFQQRLLRTNGNAAPAAGETASPHLTGQAVDLAKHGLSLTEIAWLRGYLLPLVQEGKVDVEEEFQQSCFHISVYKKYLPQPAPRREIAPKRGGVATALAVAMP
jgi:hypothetical protein